MGSTIGGGEGIGSGTTIGGAGKGCYLTLKISMSSSFACYIFFYLSSLSCFLLSLFTFLDAAAKRDEVPLYSLYL